MALIPDNVRTREDGDDIRRRFGIAQDGKPTKEQLDYQQTLRYDICTIATHLNEDVADSREKSLAITKLEEALMWAGKAIFA